VAEANFEQYSDTARVCLVGADHLKFPRTYASPEAIQVLLISSFCAFSSHVKKCETSCATTSIFTHVMCYWLTWVYRLTDEMLVWTED